MEELKQDIINYLGDDYDDSEDSKKLDVILNRSADAVVNRRYPFSCTDEKKAEAIKRYRGVIFDVATYLYDKQGAEGQTRHSESGTDRTYESAGIPESFLSEIVPFVEVF